jgi:hypothetical protein
MFDVNKYLLIEQKTRQTHLDLNEKCLERGGISTNHRGVLAQFLNTPIYGRPADLCHACHNDKCSNPKHLYWGTRSENIKDAQNNGTWQSPFQHRVNKYGYEVACKLQSQTTENAKRAGACNKGKPKSEEHKRKISESLKKK